MVTLLPLPLPLPRLSSDITDTELPDPYVVIHVGRQVRREEGRKERVRCRKLSHTSISTASRTVNDEKGGRRIGLLLPLFAPHGAIWEHVFVNGENVSIFPSFLLEDRTLSPPTHTTTYDVVLALLNSAEGVME